MTAKVENYCLRKQSKAITVDEKTRACINCEWYEQYFRKNRGNVSAWIPTDCGYCILKDRRRKPLAQPCKEFDFGK